MASIINATTTGITVTGDNSGQLILSANGSTAITANTAGHCTFTNNFASVAGYPAYQCRAWVNFDGTGTPAIRGSGNVSSITDNGTGTYVVNFTNAMPDANYSLQGSADSGSNNYSFVGPTNTTYLAGSAAIDVSNSAATLVDRANISVAVFR